MKQNFRCDLQRCHFGNELADEGGHFYTGMRSDVMAFRVVRSFLSRQVSRRVTVFQ